MGYSRALCSPNHLAVLLLSCLSRLGIPTPDAEVTHAFTLVNDGNVALRAVEVDPSESFLTGLTCTPALPASSLAVGATLSCSGKHTYTVDVLEQGSAATATITLVAAGGTARSAFSQALPLADVSVTTRRSFGLALDTSGCITPGAGEC